MLRLRMFLAASLAALAGCAVQHVEPPALTLGGRVCAAQPDLGLALVLTLKPKDNVALESVFGPTTPCVGPADAGATYAVVALPEWPEDYILSVTSIPVGVAIVAPRVQVLDASGKPVREIPHDRFSFHGTSLYAGLRIHPGERYLLVSSDPVAIGHNVSQIVSSTMATTGATAAGGSIVTFTMYRGAEANVNLVFAHNGRIVVLAEPVPKVQ